jgi:hypothetical protein
MSAPGALCHDRINNKLYCAHYTYGYVTVIDCASDRVIKTIHLTGETPEPCAFTWNPVQNRIYVADKEQGKVAVLRDSMTGVEEGRPPSVPGPASYVGPTVVRNVLHLLEASGLEPQAASLLDIAGRAVLSLKPGANDVRHLPAGAYFIRFTRNGPFSTSRLLILP